MEIYEIKGNLWKAHKILHSRGETKREMVGGKQEEEKGGVKFERREKSKQHHKERKQS